MGIFPRYLTEFEKRIPRAEMLELQVFLSVLHCLIFIFYSTDFYLFLFAIFCNAHTFVVFMIAIEHSVMGWLR